MSFFQLFQYCLEQGKRTIGDFSSEQLLHDPVLQAGLAKPKGLLGGWSPFSLKTLRLTEPLNFKSLNSALPSQIR